jgi:hypothetical protein
MHTDPRITTLCNSVQPLREQLLQHAVYASIETLRDVATFMEHHVFAVWDFMCLLKALQRLLTCVAVPWLPSGDVVSRRIVNELVLSEESDEVTGSGYISHFELYRRAMVECGAETTAIDDLIVRLTRGEPLPDALRSCGAPAAARAFVETTWALIEEGAPHCLAAAFALGREELIPAMFRRLIANLQQRFPAQLRAFQAYLDRHVQLDEERHALLALHMLVTLCGEPAERWQQAQAVAISCLRARLALWDGVVQQIARARHGEGPVVGAPDSPLPRR